MTRDGIIRAVVGLLSRFTDGLPLFGSEPGGHTLSLDNKVCLTYFQVDSFFFKW